MIQKIRVPNLHIINVTIHKNNHSSIKSIHSFLESAMEYFIIHLITIFENPKNHTSYFDTPTTMKSYRNPIIQLNN